jgi:hypothetical protein
MRGWRLYRKIFMARSYWRGENCKRWKTSLYFVIKEFGGQTGEKGVSIMKDEQIIKTFEVIKKSGELVFEHYKSRGFKNSCWQQSRGGQK